jgi:hypothetical protein
MPLVLQYLKSVRLEYLVSFAAKKCFSCLLTMQVPCIDFSELQSTG